MWSQSMITLHDQDTIQALLIVYKLWSFFETEISDKLKDCSASVRNPYKGIQSWVYCCSADAPEGMFSTMDSDTVMRSPGGNTPVFNHSSALHSSLRIWEEEGN